MNHLVQKISLSLSVAATILMITSGCAYQKRPFNRAVLFGIDSEYKTSGTAIAYQFGPNCYLLTPEHVANAPNIQIRAISSSETHEGSITYRSRSKDIALVSVPNLKFDCNRYAIEESPIETNTDARFDLVTLGRNGKATNTPVSILESSDGEIVVAPSDSKRKITPGDSGGIVYNLRTGSVLGMLLEKEVDSNDSNGRNGILISFGSIDRYWDELGETQNPKILGPMGSIDTKTISIGAAILGAIVLGTAALTKDDEEPAVVITTTLP